VYLSIPIKSATITDVKPTPNCIYQATNKNKLEHSKTIPPIILIAM
jgi:hypothetical protein